MDSGSRGIVLYSKKGADQLRDNRAADLRLCFGIRKKQVFSRRCSNEVDNQEVKGRPDSLGILVIFEGQLRLSQNHVL